MHSTGLIPVEGHDGFYRDPHTGAIINTDTNEFEKYVSKRKVLSDNQTRIEQTAKEVEEIKSEISEIKQLLLKLASGINT